MPRKPSRKTLKRKADKLWADLIKAEGKCEAEGFEFPCSGYLQAAHIVSRRYAATRHDLANGVALCQGHHFFWTVRPIEWERWVTENLMQPESLDKLKERALSANGPPNYEAVLSELEGAV